MEVVAVVDTMWAARGYSRVTLPRVENYEIDSAMDTDADQFSVTLADPNAELMALFRRNGEIRINLSGSYDNGQTFIPLLAGYGDTVGITHDGELTIQGRDKSAAALDDTAIPWSWAVARPGKIIINQARNRGFTRFGGLLRHPNSIKPLSNPLYTDGSETVWAFWYRMIRDKKMWIWTTGAGTLIVNTLNYNDKHKYLFGWPNHRLFPQYDNKPWIKVIEAEEQKNTQSRIHEVWVYSNNGKKTMPPVKAHDPTINHWHKRPLQIIPTQANVHNPSQAMKQALEELYEGKVGEIEITIRITDPGYIVQQNQMCALNVPTMGLAGEFFIVGVKCLNGDTGAIQEIRLREKNYALTKRVPLPPGSSAEDGSQSLSNITVGGALGIKGGLGTYFVQAAKDNHGPWDYTLFLATLLAICDTESSFKNVREPAGGPGWTPKPASSSGTDQPGFGTGPGQTPGAGNVSAWHRDFANAQHNPLNPFYPNREAGVGYFQLTSASYKTHADSITGVHDEYSGGRWDARANIFTGAWVLRTKLNDLHLPVTTEDFWIGVQAYNGIIRDSHGNPIEGSYSQTIKKLVTGTYLKQVQAAETAAANSSDPVSTQHKYSGPLPESVKRIIHYAENQVGKGYNQGSRFGPRTFDCSGLVREAYKAGGYSDDQIDSTHRFVTWSFWGNYSGGHKNHDDLVFVHVDDLSPGDMVFFDIPSDGGNPPQHMGIYYHDNMMIAAENPSLGVRITGIHSEPGNIMGGMRIKGVFPNVQAPTSPGANP